MHLGARKADGVPTAHMDDVGSGVGAHGAESSDWPLHKGPGRKEGADVVLRRELLVHDLAKSGWQSL